MTQDDLRTCVKALQRFVFKDGTITQCENGSYLARDSVLGVLSADRTLCTKGERLPRYGYSFLYGRDAMMGHGLYVIREEVLGLLVQEESQGAARERVARALVKFAHMILDAPGRAVNVPLYVEAGAKCVADEIVDALKIGDVR